MPYTKCWRLNALSLLIRILYCVHLQILGGNESHRHIFETCRSANNYSRIMKLPESVWKSSNSKASYAPD